MYIAKRVQYVEDRSSCLPRKEKKINIEEKPTESEYQQLREEAVKIFGIDERVHPHQLIFSAF